MRRTEYDSNGRRLALVTGDITEQEADAIVNAANSSLGGGGGVDGAIHRAGGPHILEECKGIIARIGSLSTGEAVLTSGGRLKARYVIHTVGPVWHGGERGEPSLLRTAYTHSLELARDRGLAVVAFPSISTGAYRFPLHAAARVALAAVRDFLRDDGGSLREVRFVLRSEDDFDVYDREARRLYL